MRNVFANYLLEVLCNAAKVDGYANDPERAAIGEAMSQAQDEEFSRADVDAAIERANLSKEQLAAFLENHGRRFSAEQKRFLLSSLLSVVAADGKFDEREKGVLISYIDAVGVDPRRSAGLFDALVEPFRNAV